MIATLNKAMWIGVALAGTLGGHEAAAQTAIPPTAADFVLGAAQSDQYEIRAAQVALAQSHNPRIKAFAARMIEDHTRMTDALRQAATASGLAPPPAAMSSDQAALLAALQSLRGAPFDQAYIRQQLLAHNQALAVEQSYAAAGTDTTLRKAAQSSIPMIQQHLTTAEQIGASLGDPA
jgi:putative membrane protein